MLRKKKFSLQSRYEEKISPYLYLIPALLFVGLFLIYPAVRTLYLSFTSWNGITKPKYVGLKNFQRILIDPTFKTSLINTLYWSIFSVVFPVALGFVAALSISRLQNNNIFKILLFLPYAFSAVSVGVIWSFMYQDFGAINEFLRILKLNNLTHIWLQEVPLNTFALLIAFTWRMVGVNMVLFLISLQNLPQEPIEAAKIEGSSGLHLIRKIILPMLSSTTTVVIVMAFVNGINAFDVIWVMTHGGPYRSSETLAVTMYRESFILFNFGEGSAVAILLSIIVFCSSIFYFRVASKKQRF